MPAYCRACGRFGGTGGEWGGLAAVCCRRLNCCQLFCAATAAKACCGLLKPKRPSENGETRYSGVSPCCNCISWETVSRPPSVCTNRARQFSCCNAAAAVSRHTRALECRPTAGRRCTFRPLSSAASHSQPASLSDSTCRLPERSLRGICAAQTAARSSSGVNAGKAPLRSAKWCAICFSRPHMLRPVYRMTFFRCAACRKVLKKAASGWAGYWTIKIWLPASSRNQSSHGNGVASCPVRFTVKLYPAGESRRYCITSLQKPAAKPTTAIFPASGACEYALA